MTDEVLESFIKQKIEAHEISPVVFTWQGGEPTLMGIDFFQRVIELQKKHAGHKTIQNHFQTNGLLLDQSWCELFKSHDFLIGISLDGPRDLHDRFRKAHNGSGSFDKVMAAIELLHTHDINFNTLTVVQADNGEHPLEIYQFLKDIGSGYMQFIPIVERTGAGPEVTEWSVRPAQYGQFLIKIFDEWVRKDVGEIYIQTFDVALEAWMGMQPSLCIFNETCGTELAIEHNGDLYSCDHFVSPENFLGNIQKIPMLDLVNGEQQKQFGQAKADLCSTCRTCEVRFVCQGDCPKHRFIDIPDETNRISYLCESYRPFFNRIDPYMRFMANELKQRQPASNIMEHLAAGKQL